MSVASLGQPHPNFLRLTRSVFIWSEELADWDLKKLRKWKLNSFYKERPKLYQQNGLDQSDCKILWSLISPEKINWCPQILCTCLLTKERKNLGLIFLIGYD